MWAAAAGTCLEWEDWGRPSREQETEFGLAATDGWMDPELTCRAFDVNLPEKEASSPVSCDGAAVVRRHPVVGGLAFHDDVFPEFLSHKGTGNSTCGCRNQMAVCIMRGHRSEPASLADDGLIIMIN